MLRKASESRAHVETGLGLTMTVVGVDDVDVGGVTRPPEDVTFSPKPVEAGVDDNAVQPRRHGRITPVGLRTSEGVDETLLHAVRGELAIIGGADGDGPQTIAVPAEQLAKGFRVTGDVSSHEGAIVGALEVGHVSS